MLKTRNKKPTRKKRLSGARDEEALRQEVRENLIGELIFSPVAERAIFAQHEIIRLTESVASLLRETEGMKTQMADMIRSMQTAPTGIITAEKLASMSDVEFGRIMDMLPAAMLRRVMGG